MLGITEEIVKEVIKKANTAEGVMLCPLSVIDSSIVSFPGLFSGTISVARENNETIVSFYADIFTLYPSELRKNSLVDIWRY